MVIPEPGCVQWGVRVSIFEDCMLFPGFNSEILVLRELQLSLSIATSSNRVPRHGNRSRSQKSPQ